MRDANSEMAGAFSKILVVWGAVLDAGVLGLLPLLGIDSVNRNLLAWLKLDWKSQAGKFASYLIIIMGITRMMAGLFPEEVNASEQWPKYRQH